MTPADYQKYFCKGRENEDPAALALEDWKEVQCVVPELSGYCSQDAGNVEVSILSREQISNSSFEPYEDDDEHLWDKLTDRAGIPWQEATRFREEITANVKSLLSPSASTVTVTYAIPADKLDFINAYVESIGGTRLP